MFLNMFGDISSRGWSEGGQAGPERGQAGPEGGRAGPEGQAEPEGDQCGWFSLIFIDFH